jgi:hypothetical protein
MERRLRRHQRPLAHVVVDYNWGLQPTSNVASCNLGSRYLEFVPMVWGAGSVPNLVSKVRPLSELNELTCPPGPSANHR